MFTDTHSHIFSTEYENYDDILKNLINQNVKRVIINGYDLESNKEVLKLVNKYENVYGSIGIHPSYVEELKGNSIEFIKENINNNKIIAIGEIGLDYYRTQETKNKQIEMFEQLMQIAEDNNKPAIIHNRNATDDLLKIINKYNVKGIMHCFTSSPEIAKEYIKLGYKLGIGGIVTFKNTDLPSTLGKIDIKHILLETDSPYISPEPVRNTKNEPSNIKYIAKKVADIYSMDINELSATLEANFNEVFDI